MNEPPIKMSMKKREKLQYATLGIRMGCNYRYKGYKNYKIILHVIQW